MDDIPIPLKNFLEYLDSGEVSDDYTRQLEDTVIEVRKDKKWRNMIMTVEQLIKDESKLAKKEGIKEGKKEGMDLMAELISRLRQDNRLEDIDACITDPEYRMKLFKEYGINIDE